MGDVVNFKPGDYSHPSYLLRIERLADGRNRIGIRHHDGGVWYDWCFDADGSFFGMGAETVVIDAATSIFSDVVEVCEHIPNRNPGAVYVLASGGKDVKAMCAYCHGMSVATPNKVSLMSLECWVKLKEKLEVVDVGQTSKETQGG